MPAELGPALRTHLREHHGDLALLAPHGLATDPPQVLAPEIKPGIWFHDLPALATLRGIVAAVDAGTTQAGMAMAGVAQSGPEAYRTHVASGVGTSQEGEAMWEPNVLEQWAAALRTPSMLRAHMECSTRWDRVHTSRNRGVHQSLVRPCQGACHVAESPPGPRQHDGVGVAGAAPAPAGGERGSTAGNSGMTTVARRVTSRFPRLPLFPPITTQLHTYTLTLTQRARYTHSPPVYLYPWVDIPAIALW